MPETSAILIPDVGKVASSFFQHHNKSQTLSALENQVKSAKILPQFSFALQNWEDNRTAVLNRIQSQNFFGQKLIVRSSAFCEDSSDNSMAGVFDSVLGVLSLEETAAGIDKVASSYTKPVVEDMIFIQPLLENVQASGVVFTHDPNNGSPYYIIDIVESDDTTSVTGGTTNLGKTQYIHHSKTERADAVAATIIRLCKEVQSLTGMDYLDIEFAIDLDDQLYLLQARAIAMDAPCTLQYTLQKTAIEDAAKLVSRINKKIPYVTGNQTLLGNMSDWNPAEMIGVRPRPLALSMYKEMITDRIWAYQRDKYGYKNLRSVPLLYSLAGSPFIDLRASFYSFIPKIVSKDLSSRLVDYYISRLIDKPDLHDKIEFDIVFSCYTPAVPTKIQDLKKHGFSDADIAELTTALRDLTNRMTHTEAGEWRVDRGKIDILRQRQYKLKKSHDNYAPIDRLFWHTEDCKRYGTLPFAGLARAAFVATQFLNALLEVGLLSKDRLANFWRSVETVGGNLKRDKHKMDRRDFLARYGHLRPGTYDILSENYAETPGKYFDWDKKDEAHVAIPFELTTTENLAIQEMLDENGLQHTSESLFRFFKAAIEGREYGKFIFSWSINEILKELVLIGKEYGISREDCSYVNIQTLLANYADSMPFDEVMRDSIKQGKKRYATTLQISFPNLINKEQDLWAFTLTNSVPNFVTLQQASGKVVFVDSKTDHKGLAGKVALITNADPGFDWILESGIIGFITCYGGANSHMAVRAMELNLAAVVGVGERQFQKWRQVQSLELDCVGKRVIVLS